MSCIIIYLYISMSLFIVSNFHFHWEDDKVICNYFNILLVLEVLFDLTVALEFPSLLGTFLLKSRNLLIEFLSHIISYLQKTLPPSNYNNCNPLAHLANVMWACQETQTLFFNQVSRILYTLLLSL